MRPLLRRHEPHDALDGRGLAGAVAAEQRHRLALAHLERHVVQDVALAVIGVDALDLQDRRARRSWPWALRVPAPRGRRRDRPAAPPDRCAPPRASRATSTLPSLITVISSAKANTRSMSCSTRINRHLGGKAPDQADDALALGGGEAGERLVEQQDPAAWRSAPRRSRAGAARRRRAGRRGARLEPLESEELDQRAGLIGSPPHGRRAARQSSKRPGLVACTPSRMFSRTVRPGNRLVIWNERAMPRATRRSAGEAVHALARAA